MDTLHIKIKNKEAYDHLMWFLNKFESGELEILKTKDSFNATQQELQSELDEIDSERSTLLDLEEMDRELEKIILANEG